jgi:hypothetical protein
MKAITKSKLRELAAEHGWRGVVVLAFDEDSLAGTSYGKTRADCGKMGELLDELHDDVMSGRTKVWDR